MHYFVRTCLGAATAISIASAPLSVLATSVATVTNLRTGQSIIMQTPRLTRVAVGDGKIAGIVTIGTSEIVVNGKAAGNTTLFVWTNTGRRDYLINVTEQALDDLRRMVASAIAVPGVRVDEFAASIVLNGTVSNSDDLARIADIAARFSPVAAASGYCVHRRRRGNARPPNGRVTKPACC